MRSRNLLDSLGRFLAVAVPALMAGGCLPYVADQQSARILPVGSTEVTPAFSYVSFRTEGEDAENEHVQDHYGLHGGYGLTGSTELRATVERVVLSEDFDGDAFVTAGVGMKFRLIPDQLALYVPIGAIFGDDVETSETWTIAPTLLATWRANSHFELSPSVKAIYPFATEDPELFVGLHLGAGISTNLERWALRPELGVVRNPGDDGTTWGFTIGVSIRP